MPALSPIGAITNRFPGLNIRGGGQNQAYNSNYQYSPRSSESGVSKEKRLHKVELLVRDPVLWAEFKRRVSETNHFSNAGVGLVLPEFLEELVIPGLDLVDDTSSTQTSRASVQSAKGGNGIGFNNGFGLLQSLRTMTMEPPTPEISYSQSPRSRFDVMTCPESPGSQMNLSPTKTPLTPISATTTSTASTLTPESEGTRKEIRTRGPVLDFLEQPNF